MAVVVSLRGCFAKGLEEEGKEKRGRKRSEVAGLREREREREERKKKET